MKNRGFLFVAIGMLLVLVYGCGGDGVSSREETIYIAQQDSEFSQILFCGEFRADGPFAKLHFGSSTKDVIVANKVARIIIYKTKGGGTRWAVLDGNRPPRIIFPE